MYQILQRRSLRVIGDVRVAVSTVGYTLYRREGHPISPIGVLESRKKVRTQGRISLLAPCLFRSSFRFSANIGHACLRTFERAANHTRMLVLSTWPFLVGYHASRLQSDPIMGLWWPGYWAATDGAVPALRGRAYGRSLWRHPVHQGVA